jgi:hypothetical protein
VHELRELDGHVVQAFAPQIGVAQIAGKVGIGLYWDALSARHIEIDGTREISLDRTGADRIERDQKAARNARGIELPRYIHHRTGAKRMADEYDRPDAALAVSLGSECRDLHRHCHRRLPRCRTARVGPQAHQGRRKRSRCRVADKHGQRRSRSGIRDDQAPQMKRFHRRLLSRPWPTIQAVTLLPRQD